MSADTEVFGTDGVRDRAGEGFLAPESVRRIARAVAGALRRREDFPGEFPPGRGDWIYIGRDTRASGEDILRCLEDGFRSLGHPVGDLGVTTTPGVGHAAASDERCALAVAISASHNPAEYNGIKLLAPIGAKVSTDFEAVVSAAYRADPGGPSGGSSSRRAAQADLEEWAGEAYTAFLVGRAWRPARLHGRKVALDCANGAAWRVAPEVFRRLGLEVRTLGVEPDGRNINRGCGALQPEALAAAVQEAGADFGFCFDGDADRMIPVTRSGRVLDGDYTLALAGRGYLRAGRLDKRCVVATVMSNIGLEKALEGAGIRLVRTPVGDRNVYRELVRHGHPAGGEQSGHLIFIDDFRTGDGILAAIRLLDVLEGDELDLEREAGIMTRYPQVLKNVRVAERRPLEEVPAVLEAIRGVEDRLGGEGRVLVRYSGTEPLARVMLEGPDAEWIEELCDEICRVVEEHLAA